MRYTHRTGMSQYQRCHRLYYLSQHYDGSGLSNKGENFKILVGSYVHKGIETLLLNHMEGFDENIDDAVQIALASLNNNVNKEELITYGCDKQQVWEEMSSLIEALIRAWYIKRFPFFIETYDIIEVEKDRSVPLTEGVILEFKLDALLRDKTSGLYYILSNKTTGNMDKRKINDAQTDMQGCSEIYGIETALNIKVQGVIMEWLLTGKDEIKEDKKGVKTWIQWSPLIRGWWFPSIDSYAWRYSYEDPDGSKHRLGKGYQGCHALDLRGGVKEWIDSLSKGEMFPSYGVYKDPLNEVFISSIYYRDDKKVEDWLEAAQYQEEEISEALKNIIDFPDSMREIMNQHFPQYTHSCNYPVKCSMYEICHGSAEGDPYMSGFKKRVSHHVLERERNELSKYSL